MRGGDAGVAAAHQRAPKQQAGDEKGDLLAIFSDGIVEANTREDEEFGTRRLENLLREHAQKPLAQIIEAIFTQLARFEQGRPRRDDQTLLLVRAK